MTDHVRIPMQQGQRGPRHPLLLCPERRPAPETASARTTLRHRRIPTPPSRRYPLHQCVLHDGRRRRRLESCPIAPRTVTASVE